MKKFFLFFLSFIFLVVFGFSAGEADAATSPDLSRHIIYVRDPSGNDISGATVTVTYNGNSPSTFCNIPGGVSSGPRTAYAEGNYYVVDNVCCTVSGFSVSASKNGYTSNFISVPNPWLTGQGRSTIFVNDGSNQWGGVITLTPNAPPITCTTTPTQQCQTSTMPNGCGATGWEPANNGLTCVAGISICCKKTTPACGNPCTPSTVSIMCPSTGCTACVGGVCASPPPAACGDTCPSTGSCPSSCPCDGTICKTPPVVPPPVTPPSPTPTTPASCGGVCPPAGTCPSACPCSGGICKVPVPTAIPTTPPGVPTPTKVPCGGPCSSPSVCVTACPVCSTSGTCEAPPTGVPTATRAPSPTPTTPLACGDSCNSRTDCPAGCPCTGPAGSKTCAAPTATPIPTATPTMTPTPTPDPFSPAMCKCDGIDISAIGSGRSTTVTAAGKVEGADTTYAKIQSMKFALGKGTAGATKKILESGDLPATVTEETATKVRYKAAWTFTMPTLERGVEHRIWTTFKCIKKLAILPGITGDSVVLGTSTQNPSILARIYALFANMGREDKEEVTPQDKKIIASAKEVVSKGQVLGETRRDKLQLETFIPGEVTKKSCQTIYFKLN